MAWSMGGYAQEGVMIGFSRSWVDPKADFKVYQELLFNKFDLRDIKVKIVDDEGDVVRDGLSFEIMQEIALMAFRSFSDTLGGTIAINKKDQELKDLKGKKCLVMDIKISGSFEVEEERLLMKMLKGNKKSVSVLAIEGKVIDSETTATLMTFNDQQEIDISDSPFEKTEDMEKLTVVLDRWAGHFQGFLSRKLEQKIQ
jgi:hypothetical protein